MLRPRLLHLNLLQSPLHKLNQLRSQLPPLLWQILGRKSSLSLLKAPKSSLSAWKRLLTNQSALQTTPLLGLISSNSHFCRSSLTCKESRLSSSNQCKNPTSSFRARSMKRNLASYSSFKACAAMSRPSRNSNKRRWLRAQVHQPEAVKILNSC